MSNTAKRKRGRPSKAEVAERIKESRQTNETPAQMVQRIAERFTVMYRLTQGVITGAIRAVVVSGAPGTGKTHTITHLLDTAHSKDKIRFETVHGALTAVNLYKLLYKFRRPNDIILLDDADGIFEDVDALNLLKAALDTSSVRKLSWLSESSALKADNIDTQFEYEGAIIFITNTDFQGIVDYGKGKLAPHFSALMSRSIYLDLKLHTTEELLAWCCHMVDKNGILRQHGLDRSQELEALEWIKRNAHNCRDLSIRTLLKIAGFMKTDMTNWEVFANVTLLR